MRNNETGEFELVVGNRQLLSGFFIVVLLFAVAFAMGYVVGQNAPRTSKVQEVAAPAGNSSVADARPQPSTASPAPAPVEAPAKAADTPAAQQPVESPPHPSTQPARDPNAPATTTAAAAPPATSEPAAEVPGTYWQVLATSNQAAANGMLLTLRKSGFQASLSPGPNNLTRVLVGPFTDKQAMAKAKTDLESAGFSAVRH